MEFTPGALKRHIVGQVTLNGTTEVTITVPNLEANSIVVLSVNTVAGTASAPYISTKTAGVAGTIGIKAGASNTSVVDVVVFQ